VVKGVVRVWWLVGWGAKPTPEVSNSSEHMFQSVPLLKVHCKALWAMSIMFLRHCNLNSTCERSLLIPAPLVTNVLLNLSLDLSSKFLLYLASSLCWGICTSQDGWWNKQELTSSRAISLLLASKQLRSSSTTTLILVIEALPEWCTCVSKDTEAQHEVLIYAPICINTV